MRFVDSTIQRETIARTGGPTMIIDFEQFTRFASPDEQSFDSKYSQIVAIRRGPPSNGPVKHTDHYVPRIGSSAQTEDRSQRVILVEAVRGV